MENKYCTLSSSCVVDWNAYGQLLSQELETSAQHFIIEAINNLSRSLCKRNLHLTTASKCVPYRSFSNTLAE